MNKRPVSAKSCVKLNVGNWVASRPAGYAPEAAIQLNRKERQICPNERRSKNHVARGIAMTTFRIATPHGHS